MHLRLGNQLAQQVLADRNRQTGVVAFDGVADVIAFPGVEEEHLVRFGDRVAVSEMVHVDAAIGKHQVRGARILFGALKHSGLDRLPDLLHDLQVDGLSGGAVQVEQHVTSTVPL